MACSSRILFNFSLKLCRFVFCQFSIFVTDWYNFWLVRVHVDVVPVNARSRERWGRISTGTWILERTCSGNFLNYSGDLKSDHSKSGNIWNRDFLKVGFQMVRFSNGWALVIALAIVPTNQKPDHPNSYGLWQNCVHLSRFLNGWASRFQIPLKIWTICKPTFFRPFKIQTNSDFRSPLYTYLLTSSLIWPLSLM